MALRNVLGGVLTAVGVAIVVGPWTATAWAAPGVVVGGVNLRAGPGVDYPALAALPPGTGAEIFGCLPGWTWCDVAVNGPDGGVRGWAAGQRLQVLYDNQPGYLPQYGALLGLPLIGFSIGNYWDRYYRGEPWYGSEGRWRGRDYGGDAHWNGPPRGGPGEYGRPGEGRGGFPGGYRGPEAHGPAGYQSRPPQRAAGPGGPQRGAGHEAHGGRDDRRPN
ncbi:SH3 domain-containing protein [Lichenicoccus sp.]|uniref:SH3 domain-containing protein n=1 Tax=Lichenicoccus sp. TaxID=2781899 RepID=UPI003D0CC101